VYARVTEFEGSPERMEEGVRLFREEVIPWLRDATGFRGWIVLFDRPAEKALAVTFWATEEAMTDSAKSGGDLRDEVAARMGTRMTNLAYYEVEVAEHLALDDLSER
jgi:heme-degrading monooxygenase HmoA